jgi:hypothetical protein
LKTKGSGNISGFRCAAKIKNPIVHPAGIKYLPGSKNISLKHLNCATLYSQAYQFEDLLGQSFQMQERWDTSATFL